MDYVKRAENILTELQERENREKNDRNIKYKFKLVTTSQLRKFLALSNAIYNEVKILELKGEIKNDKLPEDIINEILSMKVKLVYQCGREKAVKDFVEKSELLSEIDKINGSYTAFKDFFSYVEALTAYHKFVGGKD